MTIAVVLFSLVVAEFAIFSPPILQSAHSLAIDVTEVNTSPTSTEVKLRITHGSADRNLRLAAFPLKSDLRRRSILVYEDPNYPTASANPSLGLVDHVSAQLDLGGYNGTVESIDANGLKRVLTDTSHAADSVVVTAAGVLPADVFSKRSNLVTPWTNAGGLIVWGGATIGYFSGLSGKSLKDSVGISYGEQGSTILLGKNTATFPWVQERLALARSDLGRALDIGYQFDSAGISSGAATARGGKLLGWITDRFSSVTYLPSGSGGFILFGGEVIDPEAISHDIAQIVLSDALNGGGPLGDKNLELASLPATSNVTWQLPFAPGHGGLMLYAFDPGPQGVYRSVQVVAKPIS